MNSIVSSLIGRATLATPAPGGGTRRPTLPRTGNWVLFQSTATYEEPILREPPQRAGDSTCIGV